MTSFDAIVLLGSQPDTETWDFPAQLYACMDKAVELYSLGAAPYILVSGDRSISLDNQHISQPFRECDHMAEYLLSRGVPSNAILREGISRDTMSNLYYLKEEFFMPQDLKRLVFPIASFRIERLQLLCDKILGADYDISFETIAAHEGPSYAEAFTLGIDKEFLEPMPAGNHHWLDGKFYDAWVYHAEPEAEK